MFSQPWQVGLDIQNNSVRALAAQRCRNGWRLRHWWQQTLPQPVLREGCITGTEILATALRQWRARLPRHISLRIALPAQRVLQQTLPLPDQRLREPFRHDYITAQGVRQFPLDSQTLVVDYRQAQGDTHQLLLTAARQQELQQWLCCLRQAELQPQVIDITPSALCSMAEFAGLAADAGLLHRLEQEWLWVAPRSQPFAYGVLPCRGADDLAQALGAMHLACPLSASKAVYYSSILDERLPDGVVPWSPFTVFSRLYPPLPAQPMAFVVAGGLALRYEDN